MKTRKLFGYIIMLLFTTALLVTCSKDDYDDDRNGNGGNNNNSSTVYMKNSVFSSANIQVETGTKVTWINDDTMVHTVTADNNSFDSGDLQPGASFNYVFNSTGTFSYHCIHHPGMTGSVVVVAKEY